MAPTFVLVHGAWHGAWCWERLVPELEARGARAVTLDLPADDEAAGLEQYRDAILAVIDGLDQPVLVGHSLGGVTIPLVAAARPVRALVFLCAFVPIPGVSLSEQDTREPDIFPPDEFYAGLARDERGRSYWADEAAAIDGLYGDCDPRLARAAFARLRPQGPLPSKQPCPLETWPDVPIVSILCSDDKAVASAWSRRIARERLGVEPIELPGGHSPFLARPAALADALVEAV